MSRSLCVLTITIGTLVMTAGCAGSPERPTAEMSRAQVLIEQAERNRAQQFAAADLDRAREKLRSSDAAVDARKLDAAQRYAAEAAIDAELALARSRTAQAERSAAEVAASVETLRQEAQREFDRQ